MMIRKRILINSNLTMPQQQHSSAIQQVENEIQTLLQRKQVISICAQRQSAKVCELNHMRQQRRQCISSNHTHSTIIHLQELAAQVTSQCRSAETNIVNAVIQRETQQALLTQLADRIPHRFQHGLPSISTTRIKMMHLEDLIANSNGQLTVRKTVCAFLAPYSQQILSSASGIELQIVRLNKIDDFHQYLQRQFESLPEEWEDYLKTLEEAQELMKGDNIELQGEDLQMSHVSQIRIRIRRLDDDIASWQAQVAQSTHKLNLLHEKLNKAMIQSAQAEQQIHGLEKSLTLKEAELATYTDIQNELKHINQVIHYLQIKSRAMKSETSHIRTFLSVEPPLDVNRRHLSPVEPLLSVNRHLSPKSMTSIDLKSPNKTQCSIAVSPKLSTELLATTNRSKLRSTRQQIWK